MLGINGNIIYQNLSKKYLQNAYEVIQKTSFSRNLYKVIGVPEDNQALAEATQILEATAKDGITVIAVDKSTNRVIGTAFNKILVKSQPFYENFRNTFINEKSRLIIDFLISTNNMVNVFEKYQVNCIAKQVVIGVLPEYRKQGVAFELSRRSMDLVQKLHNGINVKQSLDGEELPLEPIPEAITTISSSFIPQKIAIQFGFDVVAVRSNKKIEIGDHIIDNSMADTENVTVMCKKLQKQ